MMHETIVKNEGIAIKIL